MLPTFKLAKAVRDNCLSDASEAIAAGGDVNGQDHEGRTILELAERCNASVNMIELLLRQGADAEVTIGCRNDSLFHLAARHQNFGFVASLASHGHSPIRINDRGETPLHIAASTGQAFLCQLLIGHGVDQMIRDFKGRTAADLALNHHHTELANWLSCHQTTARLWTNRSTVAENPRHTR